METQSDNRLDYALLISAVGLSPHPHPNPHYWNDGVRGVGHSSADAGSVKSCVTACYQVRKITLWHLHIVLSPLSEGLEHELAAGGSRDTCLY
jgi:hypothetical protein